MAKHIDYSDAELRKIKANDLVSPASSIIQKDGTQRTQIVDSSNNIISSTNNALDINIKSSLTLTEANSAAIKTALEIIDNAISGNEVQVDIITLPNYANRSDTYTATGNGTIIDCSLKPMETFSVQVKGTDAAATVWDVRLEGSLDGTNFVQILQHTNVTGDGAIVYSGANLYPSLYFRSRCAGITLGGATNIVVTILGTL